MPDFSLQHIDHVAITVTDLEASVEWYRRVLGLEQQDHGWEYPQMMAAGDTAVALFPPSGPDPARMSDAERNAKLTTRHFAFRVDRANFEAAQASFKEQGIDFEFADHGVAHSIYIEDPDGHKIELTTYDLP